MGRALYIFKSGELVRKQNTLFVESQGERSQAIPVESTDEIYVFGDISINKRMLELLTQHNIILHFFNHNGYYSGTYYPREHMNSGAIVLAQALFCADPSKRHELASRFICGAIENMKQVINYYRNRTSVEANDILDSLNQFSLCAPRTRDISALMGIEGNARSTYYKFFDRLMLNDEFKMLERTRRPPSNKMNAMISFLNSMCYLLTLSQIYRTHLDPRIGFLHETNFRRFSLNLDIAEIFKPLLVDRLIFKMVNKKIIQANHFEKAAGGIHLNEKGKEIVLRAWQERIETTIEHPRLKRNVSYRGLVRMEVYKVQKHVLGDEEYSPFVSRW